MNDATRKQAFRRTRSRLRRYRYLYLLAIPGILYFLVFRYVPMYGVVIAFQDYFPFKGGFSSIILDPTWVGLKHLRDFFSSYYIGRLIGNTLYISFLKLLIGFPGPIILALLLEELRSLAFRRVVQTISYLPHFLSWVIVAGLTAVILSPVNGPVNGVIAALGGKPISFLGDPRFFRGVLVVSDVWKNVGWGSILYLAALAGVDPTLYECATIEGVSRAQKIWYISIPSISHIIILLFILNLGNILDAGFEQVLLLYSPPVYRVGDIIDTFVYREGLLNQRYSYGAAVGLFKNVVGFVLIVLANWIAKKLGREGIW